MNELLLDEGLRHAVALVGRAIEAAGVLLAFVRFAVAVLRDRRAARSAWPSPGPAQQDAPEGKDEARGLLPEMVLSPQRRCPPGRGMLNTIPLTARKVSVA